MGRWYKGQKGKESRKSRLRRSAGPAAAEGLHLDKDQSSPVAAHLLAFLYRPPGKGRCNV